MLELTVVCVSYQRYRNIPVLIHSFLAQTLQNSKILILHDGPDPKMWEILSAFKKNYADVVDFRFSEKRNNDYGHSNRAAGLQLVDTPFVLLTNDDNYYCPVFCEWMFRAIHESNADIAMCDMLHSHNRPGGRPQAPYRYFETAPQRLSVDVGCFIAKTELAKKVGFRDKSHDGDATYFEDLLRAAGRARFVKVPNALFVHN
jgi:hypothetical protein